MNKWEKGIREKVYASQMLTPGEWVYLVGLFGMSRDHADCDPEEAIRLKELLKHADDVVIWEHTPARSGFQEEIEEALGIGDAGPAVAKEDKK